MTPPRHITEARLPSRWWLTLGLVVALAATLRFARLGWGLPEGVCFPDEAGLWLPRLRRFAAITPWAFTTTDLTYPTLYLYVSGLAAYVLAALRWIPPLDDPTSLMPLLAARGVSAAAAVATVASVAALAYATAGARTALAAGAFMAVVPLAVMQPYYASVDSLLVLCVTLTLLASWRLATEGSIAAAVVAGAAVGACVATKYTGLAFLSAVGWAIAERARHERTVAVVGRLSAAALVGALLVFALACPACVLRPDRLQQALLEHRLWTTLARFDGNRLALSIGWWGRPWLHQAVAILPYMLGLPLYLLTCGGLIAALRRRDPADRLLLAGMLPYFAVLGASSVVFPRYMLPLAPFCAVLAARGLGLATQRRPRIWLVVVTMVVAWGAALGASQIHGRFTWDQQRTVAGWLAAHALPSEIPIAVVVPDYQDYFKLDEPLRRAGFLVERRLPGKWLDGSPSLVVVPDWYATAIRRDQQSPALLADLEALESGRAGLRPRFHLPAPAYLQESIDIRLDPAFAVDLWQGTLGFTVYAREGVLIR